MSCICRIFVSRVSAYEVMCRIFDFSLMVFYCGEEITAWIFAFPGFISIVTIIFPMFVSWTIKSHLLICVSHRRKSSQHSATATDRYLNILEEPQPKPEEEIDEEKFRFIASKTSIWDFYGIPQSKYLTYSMKEK